jgi:protein-S-isoprenylcysteine O-methyltransferase Ste14
MMLRAILLSGLVGHKLLWELMKTSGPTGTVAPSRPRSARVRFVKGLKVLALAGIVLQTVGLNLWPIGNRSRIRTTLGVVMYLAGLGYAIVGRLQLGRNWANLEDAPRADRQALVTHGIYRFVRHPIYAGDFLLLIGLQLALNSWLVLVALIPLAIILRQVSAEERYLSQRFPEYEDYRRRSKRFIPAVL